MNLKKIGGAVMLMTTFLMPSFVYANEATSITNENELRECVSIENNVCELSNDIYLTQKLSINKTVTIDGNGHNLYGDNKNNGIYFEINDGVFTIQDANVSQFGGAIGTQSRIGIFKIPDNASANVKLVASNLNISDFNRSAFDLSSGTFNISNVTIDCGNSNTDNTILTKGILVGIGSNKTVGTITDSTITNSTSKYANWNTAAIEVYNNSEVNVKNVNISNVSIGIHVDNYYYDTYGDSKIVVDNANIKADDYALRIYNKEDVASNTNVSILSGIYNGTVMVRKNTGKDIISITQGTFTNDVKDYLNNTSIISTDENNQFVVQPNTTIGVQDGDGNTIVEFESEDALPSNYVLKVVEKVLDNVENVISSVKDMILNNNSDVTIDNPTILTTYDINVTDGVDVVSMENGKYTINIKVEDSMFSKYNTFKVAYINDNGVVEEILDATNKNGYVVFETTHLSTYSVIGYNTTEVNEEIKNPQTFDGILGYVGLSVISLFGLTSVGLYMKKNFK